MIRIKDPYLIQGQACEVWDSPEYKELAYFDYHESGTNWFVDNVTKKMIKPFYSFSSKYYRPIGTEWDFAPDWAVCRTVDQSGQLNFWSKKSPFAICTGEGLWDCFGSVTYLRCGICPDKTQYQDDAWKTSLRMRPDWAKVGV